MPTEDKRQIAITAIAALIKMGYSAAEAAEVVWTDEHVRDATAEVERQWNAATELNRATSGRRSED